LTRLAPEAIAEAEHGARIVHWVTLRTHLECLEVRVASVAPHQLPAAGQQCGVGVHGIGVDGEQNVDLAEEVARSEVAQRCGDRHSAQRTRPGAAGVARLAARRRQIVSALRYIRTQHQTNGQ